MYFQAFISENNDCILNMHDWGKFFTGKTGSFEFIRNGCNFHNNVNITNYYFGVSFMNRFQNEKQRFNQ